MLLFFDLDRSLLIQSRGCLSPIETARVPRGGGEIFRVQLLNFNQPWELAGDAEFRWIAKVAGDYAGGTLALGEEFEFDTEHQWYQGPVNYAGTALDALLGVADEVTIAAQFAYRLSADDEWQRSQIIRLVVHNSVWRSLDAAPDLNAVPWEWLKDHIVAGDNVTLDIDDEAETITINASAGGYRIDRESGGFYIVQKDGVDHGSIPIGDLPP